MARLREVQDAGFDAEVLNSQLPVLVEFTASWCPPCKAMVPHLESVAVQFQGKATVVSVDVEANPRVVTRYGVRGMPTMLLFRNGQVVDSVVGAVPRHKLETLLLRYTAVAA